MFSFASSLVSLSLSFFLRLLFMLVYVLPSLFLIFVCVLCFLYCSASSSNSFSSFSSSSSPYSSSLLSSPSLPPSFFLLLLPPPPRLLPLLLFFFFSFFFDVVVVAVIVVFLNFPPFSPPVPLVPFLSTSSPEVTHLRYLSLTPTSLFQWHHSPSSTCQFGSRMSPIQPHQDPIFPPPTACLPLRQQNSSPAKRVGRLGVHLDVYHGELAGLFVACGTRIPNNDPNIRWCLFTRIMLVERHRHEKQRYMCVSYVCTALMLAVM